MIRDQENVESQKREAREQGLSTRSKMDELEYQRKEAVARVEQLGLFLADKSRLCETQAKEVEDLKRQYRAC